VTRRAPALARFAARFPPRFAARFALLLLLGLLVGLGTAACAGGASRPASRARVFAPEEIPTGGPARGPADAPVTIVEFADFRCPHCRSMEPVLERVLAAYPDQVRLVFAHLPVVSEESGRAAVAAVAAGNQGAFWEMHDFLFQLQRQPLDEELLREKARQLGLDADRFSLDLRSPESLAVVEADVAAANRLGLRATPTFIVNGQLVEGTRSFETFRQLIESELALAGPRPL
jgi:protein-disulfide isomerase